MKCQACDCSSEANGAKYCAAHQILFAAQDRETAAKLKTAISAWVASKLPAYPEEKRRRGAGLWVSPEDIKAICRTAGSVDFATGPWANGLFVRDFRKAIMEVYR